MKKFTLASLRTTSGSQRQRLAILSLSIVLVLAGCSVGPDYKRPATPVPTAYTETPALPMADATIPAQTYVQQDIPAAWWQAFHSDALNALIQQSLAHNPSVAIAQANLKQALENVKAQQAAFFPSVSVDYNPTRQRIASPLASPLASNAYVYNLHTAQLNASYTLDVWGANRRQVEALQAEADANRYTIEVTYLTLISNVVNAAIQEAVLREQIRLTEDSIARQRELTDITRKARALGQMSDNDMATQEAAQAAAEAALPPLQKQLAIQRDLIKSLAGVYPGEHLAAQFTLEQLTLPSELPQALPSSLLERRPDIRVAEAMLHSASANVGIAVANRLPEFSLSANLGSSAEKFADLFKSLTKFWTVGANATEPLFDGGALKHRERAARAAFEGAAAQYQSTVIAAFQNVGDVLQSVQADQAGYVTAVHAANASNKSLTLARKQYQLGDISRSALLPIEQADLQSKLSMAQAQGNRLQDSAALFQALGGGWWPTLSSTSTDKAP